MTEFYGVFRVQYGCIRPLGQPTRYTFKVYWDDMSDTPVADGYNYTEAQVPADARLTIRALIRDTRTVLTAAEEACDAAARR